MRIVVDASVVVKWLLPEIHSQAAARLLNGDRDLWAPDLVWAEIGNVLWKKWRLRELSAATGAALLEDFRRFPLSIQRSDLLFEAAWKSPTVWEEPSTTACTWLLRWLRVVHWSLPTRSYGTRCKTVRRATP